jgi:hypothetical protein
MPKVEETIAQDLLTTAPGRAVLNALEAFLDRDPGRRNGGSLLGSCGRAPI